MGIGSSLICNLTTSMGTAAATTFAAAAAESAVIIAISKASAAGVPPETALVSNIFKNNPRKLEALYSKLEHPSQAQKPGKINRSRRRLKRLGESGPCPRGPANSIRPNFNTLYSHLNNVR
jgi:hypothetical protein